MKDSILFKPIKIGHLELKNRFVMPAMNAHMTDQNQFLERARAYFTERIKGGFGMVITEWMAVDQNGLGSLREAGAWDDCFIPALQMLTKSVHDQGGAIIAQMHHAGMIAQSHTPGFVPRAPSAVTDAKGRQLEAYRAEEIADIREHFIAASVRMKKSGFDGVEIHGAHGYLLSQFQSRRWNRRIDAYGGDYKRRFRLTREIIEGVRRACGDQFVVGYRINAADGGGPEDTSVTDTCIYVKMAEKAGADYISISHADVLSTYFKDPGFNMSVTREIRKHVQVPVIGVGRINDEHVAEAFIDSGSSDLVALGRQSICDSHFPEKVYTGNTEMIFRCLGCRQRCSPDIGCEDDDIGASCMVNPFSGKESRWKLEKSSSPKQVVIIGAGCSGLQSAWILAARGHDVTVYEQSERIGGKLVQASVLPRKYGFLQTISTLEQHCRRYGVKFELNRKISPAEIPSLDADCVISAAGSVPLQLPIEGISEYPAAEDILLGKQIVAGKKTAVLGGGSVGLETAEYLLGFSNTVDVIEMKSEAAADMAEPVRKDLLAELSGKINIYTGAKLLKADADNRLYIERDKKEIMMAGYDQVIVAFGYRSSDEIDLANCGIENYTIGDARAARSAKMAIYEATKLALSI